MASHVPGLPSPRHDQQFRADGPAARADRGVFRPRQPGRRSGWFGGPGWGVQLAKWTSPDGLDLSYSLAAVGILAEVVGAAGMLVGFCTRLAALLLLGQMVMAIALVHLHNGFLASGGGFEYPLTLGGVALALVFCGGGRFSVDRALTRQLPATQQWDGRRVQAAVERVTPVNKRPNSMVFSPERREKLFGDAESPLREKHAPPSGDRVGRSAGQAGCRRGKTVVARRDGSNRRRTGRGRPRSKDGRIRLLRLFGGESRRSPERLLRPGSTGTPGKNIRRRTAPSTWRQPWASSF